MDKSDRPVRPRARAPQLCKGPSGSLSARLLAETAGSRESNVVMSSLVTARVIFFFCAADIISSFVDDFAFVLVESAAISALIAVTHVGELKNIRLLSSPVGSDGSCC